LRYTHTPRRSITSRERERNDDPLIKAFRGKTNEPVPPRGSASARYRQRARAPSSARRRTRWWQERRKQKRTNNPHYPSPSPLPLSRSLLPPPPFAWVQTGRELPEWGCRAACLRGSRPSTFTSGCRGETMEALSPPPSSPFAFALCSLSRARQPNQKHDTKQRPDRGHPHGRVDLHRRRHPHGHAAAAGAFTVGLRRGCAGAPASARPNAADARDRAAAGGPVPQTEPTDRPRSSRSQPTDPPTHRDPPTPRHRRTTQRNPQPPQYRKRKKNAPKRELPQTRQKTKQTNRSSTPFCRSRP